MSGAPRSGDGRNAADGAVDPAGDRPLSVEHYDTDSLPSHLRHSAWSSRSWPSVAAIFESRPTGEFATEADRIDFDGLTLQFAWGTARNFERTTAKAAGDGIDVLGIGVHFDGACTGMAGGRAFDAPKGALLLLDTAQSSVVRLAEGRSMQLALPREVAQNHFDDVGALHGLVIAPDDAAILVTHLLALREALPLLTEQQKPRLARTVTDLLTIALESNASVRRPRTTDPAAVARREVDVRLGLSSLTVSSLCTILGVSRSALYRLFEAEGGVEAYIRAQRLERVARALRDPDNTDRIADLADRWGFSDASHLSRLFREKFGVAPGEYRASQA